MIKIYVVCTPPKYKLTDVNQLHDQLTKHLTIPFTLYCYTNHEDGVLNGGIIRLDIPEKPFSCERQWNKIDFMNPKMHSYNEPIIVMDIDWQILGDITDILSTPIYPNEFWAVDRWWKNPKSKYPINGGLYKFYSHEAYKAYRHFHENPEYWQEKYIRLGVVEPPVNGEQFFVYECLHYHMRIRMFPSENIVRQPPNKSLQLYEDLYLETTGSPMFVSGKLNPSIKMIHGLGATSSSQSGQITHNLF